MRIAQIAPLHEAVPPKLYGGTERVVSYLTEALVEEGHDVTLFASGDSKTSSTSETGTQAAGAHSSQALRYGRCAARWSDVPIDRVVGVIRVCVMQRYRHRRASA